MKSLLLPPLSLFVLMAAGFGFRLRWPRFGVAVIAFAGITLVALSTPVVGSALMQSLQPYPPVDLVHLPARVGAIVVLGGDTQSEAREYGGDTAGYLTLERVRYGAYLYRQVGLPLLVTGGPVKPEASPIARQMEAVLTGEFNVPVAWIEDAARDTHENATNSARLLRQDGIDAVVLVTHAWHMRRAVAAFQRAGLNTVPAPTRFVSRTAPLIDDFLPSAGALQTSSFAIHEWIGIAWYTLRYGQTGT